MYTNAIHFNMYMYIYIVYTYIHIYYIYMYVYIIYMYKSCITCIHEYLCTCTYVNEDVGGWVHVDGEGKGG